MQHPVLHPTRPLMAALASLMVACGGGGATASPSPAPAPAPSPAPAPTPAPSNRCTLVWSDEFEGAAGTLPDARHWNHDLGNQEANGWGNHELQYYTREARNA